MATPSPEAASSRSRSRLTLWIPEAMRALWALSLAVLLVATHGEAQQRAATIDLEVHFSNGQGYYQTLHAGGQLTVTVLQEEEGLVVSTARGAASVPPAMFHVLKEILATMGRNRDSERGWGEIGALVVIGDANGQAMERVVLDDLPPGQRRLLLDVFSVLHSFASEEEVDLVGPEAEKRLFGERDDPWRTSIRWHLHFIEAGILLLVIVVAVTLIREGKRSE